MEKWFLYVSLILLVFPARDTGFAQATMYLLYSCPLRSSESSLSSSSSSSSNDCPSSRKRDIYIPYGIRHTYIQIGSRCHDWGNWNYPRNISCSSTELYCCVQTNNLESFGWTLCADRIREFESAWTNVGRSYSATSWNCQVYSDKMKEFLDTCDVTGLFC
ncbi:uncharacterized protein LOC132722959 [Ruditapes philippinarum]|uniref:uncharacterized protein LOC132722959 n=1 Tax=Ruditapes philippinarum TaxID=129788 RepID=UPI00295B5310|nr:uncharacterized protein LOC132722959 [Ruditapes philippinarum]